MENIKASVGIIKDKKHYYPVHVFYNHTDAGRIVYFANYLRMTEEARVALFNMLGNRDKVGHKALQTIGDFVVRSCNAEYLKSAVLNDDLVVVSSLKEIGKVHLTLTQDIYRDDEKLVSVEFKLVFVKVMPDGSHKPSRFPEFWLDKLKDIQQ